jgi:16S rRNA (guanine527-N7)-methyltransferase
MLPTHLDLWRSTLAWEPSPQQQAQFENLYQGILAGNQQLNLTRITEPEAFWEKHLWDSLSGLGCFLSREGGEPLALGGGDRPPRLIDIGTGAGFPGLPAAIVWPDRPITLLDSTRKKINFLESLLPQLNLPQVLPWAGRAETLGQDPRQRESYDLALTRALGGVTICAEYALPLVRRGGYGVFYRGQWSQEEETSLGVALIELGAEIHEITPWKTPLTQGVRHCVVVRKVADTPDSYPRPNGVPAQKPLGF